MNDPSAEPQTPPRPESRPSSWVGVLLAVALALNVVLAVVLLLSNTGKVKADADALLVSAADAERRLIEATRSIADADQQRQQLQGEVKAAEVRLTQLGHETAAAQAARDRAKAESEDESKALRSAIELEERKVGQVHEKLISTQAALAELETRHRSALAELAHLTNGLQTTRVEATNWHAKLAQTQEAAGKASQELARVQRALSEALVARTNLNTELAASREELATVRQEAATLQQRLTTLSKDAQAAQLEVEQARNLALELARRQKQLVDEILPLEQSLDQLRKEKRTLEREVGRLQERRQEFFPSETR